MRYSSLYKRIDKVILGIVLFVSFSQIFAIWETTPPVSPSYIDWTGNIFHTIYYTGKKYYTEILIRYEENNKIVKILPYILTVHILDFLFFISWLLGCFFLVIRYLSK